MLSKFISIREGYYLTLSRLGESSYQVGIEQGGVETTFHYEDEREAEAVYDGLTELLS